MRGWDKSVVLALMQKAEFLKSDKATKDLTNAVVVLSDSALKAPAGKLIDNFRDEFKNRTTAAIISMRI